jgi:hypothetical protein
LSGRARAGTGTLPLVLCKLLACGVLLWVGCSAWPYTVDDAFIVARYARNIAAGLGYGMNPYRPSDGVTGPLWLLPEVIACRWNADPIVIAKAIGLACALLAAWLVLSRLEKRARGRVATCVAGLLLALSPSLGTWAVAGLETTGAALLVTLAALGATERPQLAPWRLGTCVASLAWLRPELALFSIVLLGYAFARDRRCGSIALGIALLGAISVAVFRYVCFGAFLPLSWSAKAGSLENGLSYACSSLVLSSSLVGAWLAWRGARSGRRDDGALGLALLVHLLAIVLAGGDWMPGYRLLVPVLPIYAWLAAVGAARMSLGRPRLAALMVVLALVVPAADLATRLPELQASARSREHAQALAAWLRDHARRVALVDIGFLGYASGVYVVDLGGLTDPRIANMPGGHLAKHIDQAYLIEQAPDTIVLHSASAPRIDADGRLRGLDGYDVERRVAALPLVRADYRVEQVFHYAPRYHYVVLTRRTAQGLPR